MRVPAWRRDVEQAIGLLIHALAMLNELPDHKRRGSAMLHAVAAAVVLGHDGRVRQEAQALAQKAIEAR